MSERDRYLGEIDRICSSAALHGSPSLCKLIRYLAVHALEQPAAALNEYQIATEALGRTEDFDPHSDSTVRVQLGRLRMKLGEYYRSEGAADEILVELPKGTHALSFHYRTHGAAKMSPNGSDVERDGAAPPLTGRKWVWATATLAVLLAAAIAAIISLWSDHRMPSPIGTEQADEIPSAFRSFWKPFVTDPQDPLAIYSNANFVGRPETGLRYFNPATDSRDLIFDQYTGVGEVMAVHALDRVFALFHRQIVVKRGQLFTLDDAQNNNLIFLGSPSENLTLRVILSTKEFVFQRLKSGPRKGDLAIVSVHPNPGEQSDFLASPATDPMTEDYAVVALMPGLNPSRSVLILAGTTTFGTQGAVEYVCRQSSIEELLLRLPVSASGEPKPFEALLHVKVANGVPVGEDLVALRERPSK